MADEKIVQEIELIGGDRVAAQFEQIGSSAEKGMGKVAVSATAATASLEGVGAASQKSFDKVATSSTSAVGSIGSVGTAARGAGQSFERLSASVAAGGKTISSFGTTANQAGAAATSMASGFNRAKSAAQGVGSSFQSATGGAQQLSGAAKLAQTEINSLNDANDQASASMNQTKIQAISFATVLRLIGKAAGLPVLAKLGRTIGVLGKAFLAAAPIVFGTLLEKLASSAAEAASSIGDLAGKSGLTVAAFQQVSSAFVGAGKTAEEAATAIGNLKEIIKQTDENVRNNVNTFRNLTVAYNDSVRAVDNLAVDIREALLDADKATREFAQNTFERLRDQREAARDFARSIQEMAIDIKESELDAAKATREFGLAMRDHLQSTQESARDFQKSMRDVGRELADVQQEIDDFGKTISKAERDRRRLEKLEQRKKDLLEQQAELQRKRLLELRKEAEAEKKLAEDRADAVRKDNEAKLRAALDLSDAQRKRTIDIQKEAEANRKADEDRADSIRKTQEALRRQDEQQTEARRKVDDAARALREAAAAAERNATVLEKLGIGALDAAGKLKQVPEVMEDIAQKLSEVTDAQKLLKAEAELIGAGIDRHIVAQLRRGVEGYKELQKEGDRLRPPFTTEQIHLADSFVIALHQVGQALGGLKDAIGLALDPFFTTFFEGVRDAVVALRQPLTDLFKGIGEALSELGPALGLAARVFVFVLGAAIQVVANLINGLLLPAFRAIKSVVTPIISFLADAFGTTFQGIVKVAVTSISEILIPAFNRIAEVLRSIFQFISDGADKLATFLNDKLGTTFTGQGILLGVFVAAVTALAIAFGSIPVAVTAVVVAIGLLAELWEKNRALVAGLGVALGILLVAFGGWPLILAALAAAVVFVISKWDQFKKVVEAVVSGLKEKWAAMIQFFKDQFNEFTQFFVDIWNGLVKIFSEEAARIAQTWRDMIAFFQKKLTDFTTWFDSTWVAAIIRGIREVIAWFRKLGVEKDAIQEDSRGGSADPPGAATGGLIRGRGTSTSDSILARLSDGEYVVKTAAVRHWGLPFMRAINNMRSPKFNMGGLVDVMRAPTLVPSFATGGAVETQGQRNTGRPLVLNIGGESFHLTTNDNDTAENLARYVTKRRLTSTGRAPSYRGS